MGNGKWGVKVEVMRASKLQDWLRNGPERSVESGVALVCLGTSMLCKAWG